MPVKLRHVSFRDFQNSVYTLERWKTKPNSKLLCDELNNTLFNM